MYEELIKRVREVQAIAEHCDGKVCDKCENRELCDKYDNKTLSETHKEAADAIEELTAKADAAYAVGWAVGEEAAKSKIPQWIPVSERLPDDRQIVLAYWGSIHCEHSDNFSIMRFYKGKEARDVDEHKGVQFCDQWGNNKAPYAWADPHGPLKLFGQNVTYWMPLPEPPVEKEEK